jgi:hypothetical protein
MKIFEANISEVVLKEMKRLIGDNFEENNQKLEELTGIHHFFKDKNEFDSFSNALQNESSGNTILDRKEYGDFQTNSTLAKKVCELLKTKNIAPEIIIEPTFGEGAFLLSALEVFPNVKKIIGVEIYAPYFWQTKFSILDYFLNNPQANKPVIELFHQNVFDFEWNKINVEANVLVLGNPPWVTNAGLSVMGSDNLPTKSNFKNQSGLDAMTGKGNFDIGESITLMMIKTFQKKKGSLAFLVKNSVIKNIVFEQYRNNFQIFNLEKHTIDAQKEFNVAVEAALFFGKFGERNEGICDEVDFYSQQKIKQFGWTKNKFVSNVIDYQSSHYLDGLCQFEWRQGIKHDCSKIMELNPIDEIYINGKNQEIVLENDLVYGLLKSSDLKNPVIDLCRKVTIVTQKKIGQDTSYIKEYYPKTWQYLIDNKQDFDNRKSSIYINKPAFSIFGVGDYSFVPFKVAISGLYKTSKFSLVLPYQSKPMMLDDTCYFIGFDNLPHAQIAQVLLNSEPVQNLIKSIVFWDSKRAITKELLCRIDLLKILQISDFEYINNQNPAINFRDWESFQLLFRKTSQLSFFE